MAARYLQPGDLEATPHSREASAHLSYLSTIDLPLAWSEQRTMLGLGRNQLICSPFLHGRDGGAFAGRDRS